MANQGEHNGTISHTGNGDTIGSYQHERSNTIVVSIAGSSVTNTAIQIDDDSPPHHIKPPAYEQSEAPPPIDASNYPPLSSHQQPPPAYEADPSKPQYPQRTQYHQEVIVEQPRQIAVIAKDNDVHDFLAVSIVLAIICCCVSIPTLLCTLPAVAFAAAARDHSNTEVARRYNCIAIFLNITAVVTGIVIIGIIIAVRFASQ